MTNKNDAKDLLNVIDLVVINLLQEKVTSLKLRNQELDDKIVTLEEENTLLVDELEKQSNTEEVLMDAIKILANKVNRDSKLLASMESYQASLEAFVTGVEEQNALFQEINAEQEAEIDTLKEAISNLTPNESLKSRIRSYLSIHKDKRNWYAGFRNLNDFVLFLETRKTWHEQH